MQINEGILAHQHQIDVLQGKSDQAFAVQIEVDEEGEIQGWSPELMPEDDFYWWQYATLPDVI